MKKAQKIVGCIIIATFVFAMCYMGYGISTLLNPETFTSFHWSFACLVTAIYFGPVLLLELIVYVVLRMKNKKALGKK